MFNAKLSTVRNMKRLRICVLVSVRPSGSATLFSASFSTLARGGSVRTFCARGVHSRATASSPRLILHLVTVAVGTLPRLLFHNVLPETLNLSEDDPRELCSECGVANWILSGNNTGRGCCSSSPTSSSASPSSGSSW